MKRTVIVMFRWGWVGIAFLSLPLFAQTQFPTIDISNFPDWVYIEKI